MRKKLKTIFLINNFNNVPSFLTDWYAVYIGLMTLKTNFPWLILLLSTTIGSQQLPCTVVEDFRLQHPITLGTSEGFYHWGRIGPRGSLKKNNFCVGHNRDLTIKASSSQLFYDCYKYYSDLFSPALKMFCNTCKNNNRSNRQLVSPLAS